MCFHQADAFKGVNTRSKHKKHIDTSGVAGQKSEHISLISTLIPYSPSIHYTPERHKAFIVLKLWETILRNF